METAAEIPVLWPDTIQPRSNQRTPRSILTRQAQSLAQKTDGLVQGEVVVRTIQGRLFHDFYLCAPKLDGYKFLLFTVVQMQHELYPVALIEEILPVPKDPAQHPDYRAEKLIGKECPTESDFLRQLGDLLSHTKTVRIIDSLVAQSAL